MFTLAAKAMWWMGCCRPNKNQIHPSDAGAVRRTSTVITKLALIGLENGGKSTIMAALSKQPLTGIAATWGCNTSDPITLDRRKVMLYDLGGSERIRGIWPEYYAECHGFIFVVDAMDPGRFEEAKAELAKARAHPYLSGKPFLVYWNKSELSKLDPEQRSKFENILGLSPGGQDNHEFRIVPSTATKSKKRKPNRGLVLGLRWLVGVVMVKGPSMSSRMESDIVEYQARIEKERRAKQERVRIAREKREQERLKAEAEAAEHPDSEQELVTAKQLPGAMSSPVPLD